MTTYNLVNSDNEIIAQFLTLLEAHTAQNNVTGYGVLTIKKVVVS